MKNTIRNWNGKEITGAEQPSIEMIRVNNISTDDIRFILKARKEKKKSLRMRAKAINCFFDILYMFGFVIPLMGTGGLIERAEHLDLNLLKNIGILWAIGIVMMLISYSRQRYLRYVIRKRMK